MSNTDKNDNTSKKDLGDEEVKQRLEKARENFEKNLEDFKSKPKLHFPCFRSTFLTSN